MDDIFDICPSYLPCTPKVPRWNLGHRTWVQERPFADRSCEKRRVPRSRFLFWFFFQNYFFVVILIFSPRSGPSPCRDPRRS
jgi:hypothetical protein